MRRSFALMVLGLPVLFSGCAQSDVYDTVYDHGTGVTAATGTAAANAAAPVALAFAGADTGTYIVTGETVTSPFSTTTTSAGALFAIEKWRGIHPLFFIVALTPSG